MFPVKAGGVANLAILLLHLANFQTTIAQFFFFFFFFLHKAPIEAVKVECMKYPTFHTSFFSYLSSSSGYLTLHGTNSDFTA